MKTVSLETIAQQSGKLHEKISQVITELRAEGTYTTDAINKSMISQVIKRETGLNIKLLIQKKYGINAAVWLPNLDNNHPFIQTYLGGMGYFQSNSSGQDIIDALDKTNVAGKVDSKNCTVSGSFSKYETTIVVGYELITNLKFTSKEVSAIILHELGHLFTYYQQLGSSVYGAVITSVIARAVMDTQDYEARIKIIKKAEDHLGIEDIDAQKYAQNGGKGLDVVLLTKFARKMYNVSPDKVYDVRNTEQMADVFAARHGAGVDLATGLNKIYHAYHTKATYSAGLFVFVEALKLAVWLLMLLGNPIHTVLFTLFACNTGVKIYDDDEARITFIKQQIIQELKSVSLTTEDRNRINSDLKAVEAIEKDLNDRRTLYQLLWETLSLTGRKISQQEAYEKKLEALLYNDLFSKANEFKTLNT